jgi:protein TonB
MTRVSQVEDEGVSSYRGTADRPDRAKAIAAVIAVHAALAFVILSGLNVRMVQQAVEQLKTFNLQPPPPPPAVQPPPKSRPRAEKKPQGAPAKKAEPTAVVAPAPKIPAPSPIPAAKVAGTGSASTSGAGTSGTGTGAGGSGNGPGGGTGGFTPARKLTKIPDREYGRFAATGIASGSVAIGVRVNPDGSVSNCHVLRSSGNPGADALMCQLFVQYVRFSPARDSAGRPIAQDITWVPIWAHR